MSPSHHGLKKEENKGGVDGRMPVERNGERKESKRKEEE
jgi:hypothetical protein